MDAVFGQIEQLAQHLREMDHTMIDPVEFGYIKGAVASLQAQVAEIKAQQKEIDGKLDIVLEKLSEARGGWKTLMWLGGASSAAGAAVSWIVANWKG